MFGDKLTVESKMELIEIGHLMNEAGLPKSFILGAIEAAGHKPAIYVMLKLWVSETKPEARNHILTTIENLIVESKDNVDAKVMRIDNLEEIAKNVRKFKDSLRLVVERFGGIKKLSEHTGIGQPSLSRFFSSDTMPRRATLLKISAALKVSEIDSSAL